MAEFERTRIMRALRQNPVILDGLLHGVTQEQAVAATDGPDGWSVVEIVCHLRDLEVIFRERMQAVLASGEPLTFTPLDVDGMATERLYAAQDLATVRTDLAEQRQKLLDLLPGLSEDDWAKSGVHPRYGEQSVERMAFQVALHDIDHLDQVTRCLRSDKP